MDKTQGAGVSMGMDVIPPIGNISVSATTGKQTVAEVPDGIKLNAEGNCEDVGAMQIVQCIAPLAGIWGFPMNYGSAAPKLKVFMERGSLFLNRKSDGGVNDTVDSEPARDRGRRRLHSYKDLVVSPTQMLAPKVLHFSDNKSKVTKDRNEPS